jgi:hypothetical protein
LRKRKSLSLLPKLWSSCFDANRDNQLSKTEFLCGLWRVLAFFDAAAATSCDDDDDEELGGQWEGDYLQYLLLAVVPFSDKQMLRVDRLHEMFIGMLTLQISKQGDLWRPRPTLVSLFQSHQDILSGFAEMNYVIDSEHKHLMTDIAQPGETIDLDRMKAKINTCSFSLVCSLSHFRFAFSCHSSHLTYISGVFNDVQSSRHEC